MEILKHLKTVPSSSIVCLFLCKYTDLNAKLGSNSLFVYTHTIKLILILK